MSDTSNQFFVILHLPRSYSEANIQALAENCLDDCLAVITDVDEDNSPDFWRIKWLVEETPALPKLSEDLNNMAQIMGFNPSLDIKSDDFTVEDVPDVNWLKESIEAFAPIHIDPFIIFGSHSADDIADILNDQDKIPLEINATTAFGTGQHPTTEGCLNALDDLKNSGFNVTNTLDMGTGTGILAVACEKLWPLSHTIGVDNDPDSVDVTRHHFELNNTENCTAFLGDGFNSSDIAGKKFDLIVANILAGPLREMAPDLVTFLEPNGKIILSGLLQTQQDDVCKAYAEQGYVLSHEYHIDEWAALTLTKHYPRAS